MLMENHLASRALKLGWKLLLLSIFVFSSDAFAASNLSHPTTISLEQFEQMSYPKKVTFLKQLFKVKYNAPGIPLSQNQISVFLPNLSADSSSMGVMDRLKIYKIGQGKSMSARLVQIDPGVIVKAHQHQGYETFVYVIQGNLISFTGDHLQNFRVISAGNVLYEPPGVCHQVINPFSVPVIGFEVKTSAREDLRVPCAKSNALP